MKIIHINELIKICGYWNSATTINSGYGCNHHEQSEKDEEQKDGKLQGKCYAFSCPLGPEADLEDMRNHDNELYNEWKNEDSDPSEMGGEYVLIDEVLIGPTGGRIMDGVASLSPNDPTYMTRYLQEYDARTNTKTIVILSAIHGRPVITDLFLTSLVKCIGKANTVHRYVPFIIATTGQGAVCFNSGISYGEYENNPLGRKWNKGLEMAKDRYDPDYIMILGSDDFISPSYLEYIDRRISEGYDLISPKDIYYYSINWKRRYYGDCGYYAGKNTMLGVGRTVSKRVLDAIGWKAWDDDINNGMDGCFLRKIMATNPIGIDKFSIKDHGVYILDIKSYGNIGGIGAYALHYMKPMDILPEVMSDEDIKEFTLFKEEQDKEYTERNAKEKRN